MSRINSAANQLNSSAEDWLPHLRHTNEQYIRIKYIKYIKIHQTLFTLPRRQSQLLNDSPFSLILNSPNDALNLFHINEVEWSETLVVLLAKGVGFLRSLPSHTHQRIQTRKPLSPLNRAVYGSWKEFWNVKKPPRW